MRQRLNHTDCVQSSQHCAACLCKRNLACHGFFQYDCEDLQSGMTTHHGKIRQGKEKQNQPSNPLDPPCRTRTSQFRCERALLPKFALERYSERAAFLELVLPQVPVIATWYLEWIYHLCA